jgi:hypothetical protein
MIGGIPPTPGLVDQFFNTSTGLGEDGEFDRSSGGSANGSSPGYATLDPSTKIHDEIRR